MGRAGGRAPSDDAPRTTIDLNCDLGEVPGADGRALDAALLTVVTSANVACGFHAGDRATMRESCERAAERGVQVGAHPSYLDREHFGRRDLDVPAEVLTAQVAEQVGTLMEIAASAGTRVVHVKPHGALYHRVAHDRDEAVAFLAGVRDGVAVRAQPPVPDDGEMPLPPVEADVAAARLSFAAGPGLSGVAAGMAAGTEPQSWPLTLVGPPGAVVLELAADAGIPTLVEGFADRAYAPDGSLVPRGEPGAVLHDHRAVAAQAVSLARTRTVQAVDGSHVRLDVGTICLHGDTPGALTLAREVRAALMAAGVTPTPVVARTPEPVAPAASTGSVAGSPSAPSPSAPSRSAPNRRATD